MGGYRAEEIVAVIDDGWWPLGGGHHYEPFGSWAATGLSWVRPMARRLEVAL